MSTDQDMKFEERLRMLEALACDNPSMDPIIQEVTSIPYIDRKTAIIHIGEDKDNYYKYATNHNPKTGGWEKLKPSELQIVRRGLGHQYAVKDIDCVQGIDSMNFVKDEYGEDIHGLTGRFEYIHGKHLKEKPLTNEPDLALRLFQELYHGLTQVHKRGIIQRDIKPANIVYNGNKLIVIDWSLAANFAEDLEEAEKNIFRGTEIYYTEGAHNREKSRDFSALGLTFVKTLFPETKLRPYNSIEEIKEFEEIYSERLSDISNNHEDFLRFLLSRPFEYTLNKVLPGRESNNIPPSRSHSIEDTVACSFN